MHFQRNTIIQEVDFKSRNSKSTTHAKTKPNSTAAANGGARHRGTAIGVVAGRDDDHDHDHDDGGGLVDLNCKDDGYIEIVLRMLGLMCDNQNTVIQVQTKHVHCNFPTF